MNFQFFNHQKKKYFAFLLAALLFIFITDINSVSAQIDAGIGYGANIGLGERDPKDIIVGVIQIFLGFLGLLAVILIMYAGFTWMTSNGEPAKVEKAKKTLIAAMVGLLIVLAAWGIVYWVVTTFQNIIDPTATCEPACDSALERCCPGNQCCGRAQFCCSWGCSDNPCSTPPVSSFYVANTSPADGAANVIRNKTIRFTFNDRVASTTVTAANFRVEDGAGNPIAGSLETRGRVVEFRPSTPCPANPCNAGHCLPENTQIRATAVGPNGIESINGLDLTCTAPNICQATFTTGESIDCLEPRVGLDFSQVCASPVANLSAWAQDDDSGVDMVNFFVDGLPAGTADNPAPAPAAVFNASVVWNASALMPGTRVRLRAEATDLDDHIAADEQAVTLRPEHCCDGIMNEDEIGVDCGGSCAACDGAACGASLEDDCDANDIDCHVNDDICASRFCDCTASESDCATAGYAAGIGNCCTCRSAPIIYSVSPIGGYCESSPSRPCHPQLNPCPAGNCNMANPNGAANNLVTITGRNFGNIDTLLENVLSNVDFEIGAVGAVPQDWSRNYQAHARAGITDTEFFSGRQSVWLHQDAGQPWPGTCSQALCQRQGIYSTFPQPCVWTGTHCDIANHPQCTDGGQCLFANGQSLGPLSANWRANNVMWAALNYDIKGLDFRLGDRYSLRLKYKGNIRQSARIMAVGRVGWSTISWPNASDPGCTFYSSSFPHCATPGACQCADDPDNCCGMSPSQTRPYAGVGFPGIPAGNYPEWRDYEAEFVFNDVMASWRDSAGDSIRNLTVYLSYYDTTIGGSDLYIDNFQFVHLPGNSSVRFAGVDGVADDRIAPFPSTLNPNCLSSWRDNYVVVAVPEGASSGNIELTINNGLFDATNDSRGPLIPNFVMNNLQRPGICLADPDNGGYQDDFRLEGINLAQANARFGDLNSKYIDSQFSNFIQNFSGTARVPFMAMGETTVFVTKNNSNVLTHSNYLPFFVGESEPDRPYIISFDPQLGRSGQYVTIRGRGFGSRQGASRVCFGASCSAGTEASYDFPQICRDSIWTDTQVIVKVPDPIANGQYLITMQIEKVPDPISTADLSPSRFTVDQNQPLAPSLCRIMPTMGPHNSPIYLWGEYFDAHNNASSRVRFYLNQDRMGAGIASWAQDVQEKVWRVETTVHENATTGPVRIVKGSSQLEGNGMNFRVGECAGNEECGTGQACCPEGSFNARRCVQDSADCDFTVPASVFEWDFSTEPIDPDPVTCSGFADAQSCLAQNMCPNSPGQCQTNAGLIGGECDDNYCASHYPVRCAFGACEYRNDLNRCVVDGEICDQTKVFVLPPSGGQDYSAQCRKISSTVNAWQFDAGGGSCPAGSFQSAQGGLCTVGTVEIPITCALCSGNLSCMDGACAIRDQICPNGTACNAQGRCVATEPTCECCCRIDVNGAAEPTQAQLNAQDCCAGLECRTVGCGGSLADCEPDPQDCLFGKCTGCRVEFGNPANVSLAEQTASDEACNCTSQATRYCKIVTNQNDPLYDNYNQGVCEDKIPCDGDNHTPSCNADGTMCDDDQACNPFTCYCEDRDPCDRDMITEDCEEDDALCGQNSYPYIQLCEPDDCLCDYVRCSAAITECDPRDDVCEQLGEDYFCDPDNCYCRQETDPPLPVECDDDNNERVCDPEKCSQPFQCLIDNGSVATTDDDCGVCCCDPNAGADECALINPGLECTADRVPCSGANRGLCCGCDDDEMCGDEAAIGCGSDTCCYARPEVNTVIPIDETRNICRNALMRAVFNQRMSLSSFTGNVLLIGDYGNAACPEFTQHLALADEMDSSKRINLVEYLSVWKNPFIKTANAYWTPNPTHNYCALPIDLKSYHGYGDTSNLEIYPRHLMDARISHWVVLKGDQGSSTASAIRNEHDVELRTGDSPVFGAFRFDNAHVWSFRTGDDACQLASVSVSPASYLFQTAEDDVDVGNTAPPVCDDDDMADMSDPCFNSLNDRDYVFAAHGRSIDGQELASIPDVYAWDWSWASDRWRVVQATALPDPMFGLATAQNVKDDYTYIRAIAQITADTVFKPSTLHSRKIGRARVQVFVCENPWPPQNADTGEWLPWADDGNNCTVDTDENRCANNNFEMYYCRDDGRKGTADDLPAIMIEATIRERTPEFLKEYFFFRENVPDSGSSAVNAANMGDGERARITWSAIPDSVGYKIYYGTQSGNYSQNIDVGNLASRSRIIDGLETGKTYYFAITGYTAARAESDYTEEAQIVIRDTEAPAVPNVVSSKIKNGEAVITWRKNTDDTESYFVHHGLSSGVYGTKKDVGNANTASIRLASTTIENYFAVSAVDESGNESSRSQEIVLIDN